MSIGFVILVVALAAVTVVAAALAVGRRRLLRSLNRLLTAAPVPAVAPTAPRSSSVESLLAETSPLGPAGPTDPTRPDEAIAALAARLGHLEATAEGRGEWMRRLAAAMAAMTEGVVIANSAGEVIFREGAGGADVPSRHGQALLNAALHRVLGRACDGLTVREEVRLYGPPEQVLVLDASPLGEGALALVTDMTDMARVEALRRDFVANISHELRTPVGAISLLAETLVDVMSDAAPGADSVVLGVEDHTIALSLAGRLVAESERMTRTIDDLAELSRVEGDTGGERSVMALGELVGAVVERLANAAEQCGVTVKVTAPEEPVLISADRRQISSALHNLLDNALKYSPAGSVVNVRIRRDRQTVEVSVQDMGIGIPQSDLDRIFERFYRVDRSRTTASGGIGLGLAIVRHVVINHSGDVKVQSMEGEGSTFTIRLPCSAGSSEQHPVAGDAVPISTPLSAVPQVAAGP